jgi:tetratricopeptide (TPR) repeat protein
MATDPDPHARRPNDAIDLARQACQLSNDHPLALDALAAAYAAAGRFPQAVGTAQNALANARQGGNVKHAAEIASRLQLYQSGKPYVRTQER